MGLDLQFDYGQTPLDPEEIEGLKIHSITTKAELDEHEQQNIEDAMVWLLGLKAPTKKIISEKFIIELHKRMYKNIWKWAGKFRTSEKNIGVRSYMIATDLKILLDDALFWIANETYPADEIAIRFKHRLVAIHCFPNGNGRHSRIMADVILEKIYKQHRFSWGLNQVGKKQEEIRTEYINTIRQADHHDIVPLLNFAKS